MSLNENDKVKIPFIIHYPFIEGSEYISKHDLLLYFSRKLKQIDCKIFDKKDKETKTFTL